MANQLIYFQSSHGWNNILIAKWQLSCGAFLAALKCNYHHVANYDPVIPSLLLLLQQQKILILICWILNIFFYIFSMIFK